MKARIGPYVLCPSCGEMMENRDALSRNDWALDVRGAPPELWIIVCTTPGCPSYEVPFAAPAVELELFEGGR